MERYSPYTEQHDVYLPMVEAYMDVLQGKLDRDIITPFRKLEDIAGEIEPANEGFIANAFAKLVSFISPTLADMIMEMSESFSYAKEVEVRIETLAKGSFRYRSKIRKLNFSEYRDELFPVINGLSSPLLDTIQYLNKQIINYKTYVKEDIDKLLAILAVLHNTKEAETLMVRYKGYFKDRSKGNIEDTKTLGSFFDINNSSNMRPLSSIIRNFSESEEIFKELIVLSKGLDHDEYAKIKDRVVDIRNTVDAALRNIKESDSLPNPKLLASFMRTTAEDIDLLSRMTYTATGTVGTMESIVNYFVKEV